MTIGRIDINEKDLPKICGAIIQLEERADETLDTSLISSVSASGVGGGPSGGRLTLQTGVPVMTSTQSGKTTLYFTPYNGASILIYDGTTFTTTAFTELSNITTNSATGSSGPAAVAASSVYDLFVWDNGGTPTLTRGPVWTSDTARSAGTALTTVNGVLLNSVSITNGPAASRGTYVGTIRSDGSSQLNWINGAIAANGTAGVFAVWNCYNRVRVMTLVGDSTDSWTYSTATWRSANGSNTMRVSYVCGRAEDYFEAQYHLAASEATQGWAGGVGYDSTNTMSGLSGLARGDIQNQDAIYVAASLGFHFFQAIEISGGGATVTFYGDNGTPTLVQTGLFFEGWM